MGELNNQALEGSQKRAVKPWNFETAAMKTFDNLRNVVTGGIQVDNLIMLRTRFLLDWNTHYAEMYPCELFDTHHRLLLKGHFDAYNQWLFGRVDDEKKYNAWTQEHNQLMNEFDAYFRVHRMQPKANQYYHNL